ncbi:NAD-dependent epimerase/dehydratase family protein [Acidobacteriota bacterium]
MSKRALVTGATGFIGSHLVQELLSKDWEVTCLVRPESQTDRIEPHSTKIIRGSVDDPQVLENGLRDQDYVFHLAAKIRGTDQHDFERANHIFTKSLVQTCLRVNPVLKRFIYVSSIAAAGPSAPGIIHDETTPESPVSEYGRSKLKGEIAVEALWDQLPATILRLPNVFGPGQQEAELLIKLIRKRICPVLRERGKTTSLIYIKDLITGILQAAVSPKTSRKIYFLTDGQFYSWREIIQTLRMPILGSAITIPIPESAIFSAALVLDLLKALNISRSRFGRRAWMSMTQRTWLFSSKKAANDFGFAPEFTLITGIQDMLERKDIQSFPNA